MSRALIFVAMLCLAMQGFAGDPVSHIYVLNSKHPAVSIVDTTTWQSVGSIPLDPQPSAAMLSKENRFLYVLHDRLDDNRWAVNKAAKKASHLSIIDLHSQETVRRIDLGWNVRSLQTTEDKRHLVFYSPGRGDADPEEEEPGLSPLESFVTIIDTWRDNAVTTVRVGPAGTKVIFSKNLSRVFALSLPQLENKDMSEVVAPSGSRWKGEAYSGEREIVSLRKERVKARAALRIFAPPSGEPVAAVDLEQWPEALVLSPDEKYVYVLDLGITSTKQSRHQDGLVQVVEAESGKLVKHYSLGANPDTFDVCQTTGDVLVAGWNSEKERKTVIHRLHGDQLLPAVDTGLVEAVLSPRLDGLAGRFVAARNRMCFWPDGSAALEKCVILEQPKLPAQGTAPKKEAEGELSAKHFDGQPTRFTYLPRTRKLVIADPGADRVGIVNMEQYRLVSVVTTGRGGVKFGKVFGAMVASSVLSAAVGTLGYVASGGDATPLYIPWFEPGLFLPARFGYEMAIRSDDTAIYALNSFSGDVTIIDIASGRTIDKIAVGDGALGIGFTPGEKFLVAQASGQITFIDAATNRKINEYQFARTTTSAQYPLEQLNSFVMLRSLPRLVALTSKSLVVFDADRASHLATVKGYSEPYLLLEPEPAAQGDRPR